MVNGLRVIGLVVLMVSSMSLFAKVKVKSNLTPEQEQQFLYYFYAASHAIEQQDYPKAFVLLDFCEQINPNDALVQNHLGVIYTSVKQKEKAVAHFKKAYELSPGEYGDYYVSHLLDNEQWKAALKAQDKIDSYNGLTANSALTRYYAYVGMRKGKQAVAEIDRYLEKNPESLTFLLFRAEIHVRLGEEKPVFDISQRIAKLMPMPLREYDQITKVPHCAYYVSHLITYDADSLMNIGQTEQAYMYYKAAMYLWPKNMTAVNNYAYGLALHGGDLSRAEKMSSMTIQEDGNNPVFLDTYAWILHLKGQDSLAVFYLKKALENAKDAEVKAVIVEHLKAINGEK